MGLALVKQRDVSRLQGELENYNAQAQKHVASKQPVYAPPVSKEQREQRQPHEMDVYDVAKVCGLDPKYYLSYKQHYDMLKAKKAID